MSRSRISSIIVSAFVMLMATASWFPAEAQLRRLRRAAERAAEREVVRQVDRAVTGMVRCAFNDPACIEKAKEDGDAVEITDEDGNVLRDANGNPISDPEYAEASQQKPGEGAWRNYDFVPGERMLFYEDYTNDNVGDFPRRIEFLAGNMEVVDSDGLRILRVTAGSQRNAEFAIPLPETLPERFTLEFPVHWASGNRYLRVYFEADGAQKPPAGGTYQLPHLVVDARQTGIYDWQEDSPIATESTPHIHDGWVTVRLMADGDHVKAYVNEKRVANVPQAQLGRDSKIWFTLRDGTDDVPIYVGAITVAAGGRDLYDRLEAEGSVATRGILFATDSDGILPESTPVLEEIGAMLRDHPDLRLGITGHTDSEGGDEYNLDLSNRRAASVLRYLVDAYDIDVGRLESEGMGETAPVDTNDSPEGRANNRRVELRDLREGAGTGAGTAAVAAAEQPNADRRDTAPTVTQSPVSPKGTEAGGRSDTASQPVASAASAQNASGAEGEITIVYQGESRTLPLVVNPIPAQARGRPVFGSRWLPPYEWHDDPGMSRIVLYAGGWKDFYAVEGPAAGVQVNFDVRTLVVRRGQNEIRDSRVTGEAQFNPSAVAASDLNATSTMSIEIEAFEVRDGSAFVRGRFDAPDRQMSGTFWGLVPAQCGLVEERGQPQPSAAGCYPGSGLSMLTRDAFPEARFGVARVPSGS